MERSKQKREEGGKADVEERGKTRDGGRGAKKKRGGVGGGEPRKGGQREEGGNEWERRVETRDGIACKENFSHQTA